MRKFKKYYMHTYVSTYTNVYICCSDREQREGDCSVSVEVFANSYSESRAQTISKPDITLEFFPNLNQS